MMLLIMIILKMKWRAYFNSTELPTVCVLYCTPFMCLIQIAVVQEIITAGLTPNSQKYQNAGYWFESFFEESADNCPNRNEMHMEVMSKAELYVADQAVFHPGEGVLTYNHWNEMWKTVYPHVKMRVYKQVTGKCWTCLFISERRKVAQTRLERLALKELHQMHRSGLYMLERKRYKDRCEEAIRCEKPLKLTRMQQLHQQIIFNSYTQLIRIAMTHSS